MAKVERYVENLVSRPRWMADYSSPENRAFAHFPAKILATDFQTRNLFVDLNAVKIVVSGAHNVADSTLVVEAINWPAGITVIPEGTTFVLGSNKFATTRQDFTKGVDTEFWVQSLPTALVGGEIAYYRPRGSKITVPSGTLLGRTFGERNANYGFGPAADGDDEIYLSAFDIIDLENNANVELYNHGLAVKEEYLPDWATIEAGSSVARVKEVQILTVGGTLSAGTYRIGINYANPERTLWTGPIAYNANLAAIQSAVDNVVGGANRIVLAGTIAELTITFDSATYFQGEQPITEFDSDGLTGLVNHSVVQQTVGVAGSTTFWKRDKIRELYKCIRSAN